MGKVKKVRGKYEKTKHPKVKCFLHMLGEAEIDTIPKTQNMGIVKLLSMGKLWRKRNIPMDSGSYIFHSTLFCVK